MVATTMPSTLSLLNQLRNDYPQIHFTRGDHFRWSSETKTLFYTNSESNQASLLHELAHAILEHKNYSRDIELIRCERDAWHFAQHTLAVTYDVIVTDEMAQNNLDTYRDWLHARSTCPACSATGIQNTINTYSCPACRHTWKVNEARNCALRRYSI